MLDLLGCNYIKSIPTIGQLQHLTQVWLRKCENLKQLPLSIGSFSSLLMLDLFFCKSIESLPTMIGQLQHLAQLQLIHFENLKELP
jgi:hypothetical protein